MRNWLLVWMIALPVSLFGQAVLIVPPEHCVYKAGDDPRWAAPGLDETGWLPYAEFQIGGDSTHVWVRCHVDFPLASVRDPSIMVSAFDAYQSYVDGVESARFPYLGYGPHATHEQITRPLPASVSGSVRLVAVRVSIARIQAGNWVGTYITEIRLGEREQLIRLADSESFQELLRFLLPFSCYLLVSAAGLFLWVAYLQDRTHIATLWLALTCLGMGIIRVSSMYVFFVSKTDFPFWSQCYQTVWTFSVAGEMFCDILFFFAVAGRRMPRIFYLVPATLLVLVTGTIAALVLPPQLALPLSIFIQIRCFKPMFTIFALGCLAPFVAFWPWRKLSGPVLLTAVLCASWGVLEAVYLGQQVLFGRAAWLSPVQTYMSCAIAGVVLWLLVLGFRDHRTAAIESAILRGEFSAARQIQRMLVPEKLDVAPGMTIGAAFLPASEVGGDFYHCRILKQGVQRVLIGDVSGKGVAAALTSALLLGAADRCDHLPPNSVLKELNLALRHSGICGFTTCLCADLSPQGILHLANGGHLPPYLNGAELPLDNSLPLGVADRIEYTETALQFASGDTLTLLSDGIVEARNAAGELFGFERTLRISAQPAQEIAEAAKAFGQTDDITVLTLTLTPAPA